MAKPVKKNSIDGPSAQGMEGKESKERYYDLKRRVLRWEKNNYTKLAVLDAGKGWYKMFGNSAIIYVCQIAKRLKVKATLVSDTDYELTTDVPVVLITNFAKLKERLAELSIHCGSMKDGAYVFDLGYKVDPADLTMMLKENDMLRERANKLVLPIEVFPGLRNELRILSIHVYEATRKMNPTARVMVGDDLSRICARVFENFTEAANGHTDMRQYLKTTVKDLRRMDAKLLLASDLRLFDDKKIYNLILQVGKTQKKVAGALMKAEKEQKEQGAHG